jgi:hypothetical protein
LPKPRENLSISIHINFFNAVCTLLFCCGIQPTMQYQKTQVNGGPWLVET